jgi:hypothetical protein
MLYNYYFDPNNIIVTIVCYRKLWEHNNNFQQDHKIHDTGDVTTQLAAWL